MSLSLWTYQPPNTSPDKMIGLQYMESTRDSARNTYTPNASEATRIFYIPGFDEGGFVNALMGYADLDGSTPPKILRELPDFLPQNDLYYCYDTITEPLSPTAFVDSPRPQGQWNVLKVTAKYKPVPYSVKADADVTSELDRFTSRKYEVQTEFVTVQGQMKFVRTGRALNRQPGKYVTKIIKTMTWHNVPATNLTNTWEPPNFTAIKRCMGRVNSTTFDLNQGNHPPGTVLFLGYEPVITMPKLNDDKHHFDIVMKFQIFDAGISTLYPDPDDIVIGHNWIFDQVGNPGAGFAPAWDILTSNGQRLGVNAARIYDKSDLNTLWTYN